MGGILESIAGPAVGGLIGAAGSLFSGSQASRFAEKAYKHRYQWQVKDMQKAGINPMLAFSQAPPNVPQPNFPNLGEGAVRGISAGSSARIAAKQVESNIALQSAQATKAGAEAGLAEAQRKQIEGVGTARIAEETAHLSQQIRESQQRMLHVTEQINKARTENEQYSLMLQLERDVKKATADGMRAQIPMKELAGQIALLVSSVVNSIQDESAQRKAGTILQDTVNMLEDKTGHARNAAKALGRDTWNYIQDLPRDLSRRFK